MDTQTLVFGIGALIVVLVLLGIVAYQNRQSGALVTALTDVLSNVADNTRLLDLIEPLATKVVTPALVGQYDKASELLKTFTPDQVDKLIDAFTLFIHRTTDALPNTPVTPTPGDTTITTTISPGANPQTTITLDRPLDFAPQYAELPGIDPPTNTQDVLG